MLGLQQFRSGFGPDAVQDGALPRHHVGELDCPSPWLRAWVEFQVDARINQALRDLAEGELAAALTPSVSSGRGASHDAADSREMQRVAEAHASLLEVVMGLVGEVDRLSAAAKSPIVRLKGDTPVARLEASIEELHVQCMDEAARSEAVIQENRHLRSEFKLLEEHLHCLQKAYQKDTAPLRPALERLELRLSQWQAEVATRMEGQFRSSASAVMEAARFDRLEQELANATDSRRHLGADLKRLEKELTSTADAWAEHEGRICRLESDITASAEAHNRHEECFDRLSSELTSSAALQKRLDVLERHHSRSLDLHSNHESRFGRFSEELAVVSDGHSRVARLERELSLSAEAHGRHEGRFERLMGDVEALGDVHSCMDKTQSELTKLLEGHQNLHKEVSLHSEAHRRHEDHLEELKGRHTSSLEHLGGAGDRIARLEQEIGAISKAHSRQQSQFEKSHADRLENVEKELATVMADRLHQMDAHSSFEDRLKRLSSDVGSWSERHRSRLEQLERTLPGLEQAHGSHNLRFEQLEEQLASPALHSNLERQIKDLRGEISAMDVERRLRRSLQDVDHRLEEGQKGMHSELESWQSGIEQDLSALQRRSAAELRVEVRTAIRNEAAAVAALDEQLWLTDQRLGQRIDDLEQAFANPVVPASSPPRERKVVCKPTTPLRVLPARRQPGRATDSAASVLAARAAEGVSDTSDVDPLPSSLAVGMASFAAEAMTKNIDLRRRSGGRNDGSNGDKPQAFVSASNAALRRSEFAYTGSGLGRRSGGSSAFEEPDANEPHAADRETAGSARADLASGSSHRGFNSTPRRRQIASPPSEKFLRASVGSRSPETRLSVASSAAEALARGRAAYSGTFKDGVMCECLLLLHVCGPGFVIYLRLVK
ncbi:unnamed protein product [Polarella glacialis]|uniref:Uncharacterized protein n=1 Tax=Polarella glacialis TaxID=89957 RepID=A0A813I013_POLGL|nr:unnamed protein product [Polarella glacialis]